MADLTRRDLWSLANLANRWLWLYDVGLAVADLVNIELASVDL